MKNTISQQLLDLDALLIDAQLQYQSQLDTMTAQINEKKCILEMAMLSPIEINSVDDIIKP